jgi:hypothetical protein
MANHLRPKFVFVIEKKDELNEEKNTSKNRKQKKGTVFMSEFH